MSLPPHLSGAIISALVDSEVAERDRARVLSHLSRCSGCRDRLELEHATKDAVNALSVGVPPVSGELQGVLLALGAGRLPGGAAGSWLRPPGPGPTSGTAVPAVAGGGTGEGSAVGTGRPGRTGGRPGAVGMFSVLGLGIGLAAAALVPTSPTPLRTSGSPVGGPVGSASAVRQPTGRSTGGVVRVAFALPAAGATTPPAGAEPGTPRAGAEPGTPGTSAVRTRQQRTGADRAPFVRDPVLPDVARPGAPTARTTFVRSVSTGATAPVR